MRALRRLAGALLLLAAPFALADEDPLGPMSQLIKTGRAREARAHLQTALTEYANKPVTPRESIVWLLLGAAESEFGDAPAARAAYRQAVEKFIAVDEPFGAWLALIGLAHVHSMEDQFDEAIAYHERALAMLAKATEPQAPFSLETMRLLAPLFGVPPELFDHIARSPAVVRMALFPLMEIVSRTDYSKALVATGRLDEAEAQLTRAGAVSPLLATLVDAPIALQLGHVRRRQWRLEEARASYLKALANARGVPAMLTYPGAGNADILAKLAEIDVLRGHTDDALAWNDQALKLARDAADLKREASRLQDRGTLLMQAGRHDSAVEVYEQALALARKTADCDREATLHVDLGTVHFYRGRYGSAARELERAIALFQEDGTNPYSEAAAWVQLANVRMMLDFDPTDTTALDNARTLAKKSGFGFAESVIDTMTVARGFMAGNGSLRETEDALLAWWQLPEVRELMFGDQTQAVIREIFRRDGPPAPVADVVLPGNRPVLPLIAWLVPMLKARVAFQHREWAEVRRYAAQALAANPSADHRVGLYGLVGASHWIEGNREEAVRNLEFAADVLNLSAADVRVEEQLAAYLGSTRRWYYELLISMLVEQGRPTEAFSQAERARARAFLQLVGNHRLNAEHGADAKLVREAETLRTHIAGRERELRAAPPEAVAGLNADLELERERYRNVMVRVKLSNPEYAAITSVEPLDLDEIRRELPSGVTLLSYFVTAQRVHAWVVDRDSSSYALLPFGDGGLQRVVCWADQFAPREEGPRGAAPAPAASACKAATAEEAFQLLIAPLLDKIRNAKLIVIPHGVLHYVPFAALRNGKSGHYLIQDYTLTFAPSASALRFLRSKESPVDGQALILGDPDSPLPSLARLPGAEEEAAAIARILKTKPHLGLAAREALLYETGGKADLVHLAAHGIYDPANPLFSRIALAGDDAYDGSLLVDEILGKLDLSGVNLVVLSACRSAVGARSGGDEIVGLTRALLYAGTPGVISTLWNIDDAASAGLMVEFYRRLAGGAPVAEALRQAQLTVLGSPLHAHPKYWAAFTLHGDPQGRWTMNRE